MDSDRVSSIRRVAMGIRRLVFQHTIENNGGYLSQACSAAEIFSSLYMSILKIGVLKEPLLPGKFPGVPSVHNKTYTTGAAFNGAQSVDFDRFFLSPSQYSLVLYATLVQVGRMAPEGMKQFNKDGGIVEMIGAEHSPGMEVMSGSLGQGISQAVGIALARKLHKELGRCVLFMSDGEFQIGQTWEAIQAASYHQLGNMLIYVDVNGYQCDGKMTSVMNIEPLDERLRSFGWQVFKTDGHDISHLLEYGNSMLVTTPTIVLCYTCPYKELTFLEKRGPKFHYVRFSSESEREEYRSHYREFLARNVEFFTEFPTEPETESKTVEFVKSNNRTKLEVLSKVHARNLVEFARNRSEILVLSADLTSSTEVDLFRDQIPDRFFSMGIAEQNMMSVAGGLAREAFVPYVHTFAVFITRRAFDQIAMSIAYPNCRVRMVGFLPGICTPGGATHQATDDLALMCSLPNMTVVEVGDATDIETCLDATHAIQGPVYIRMLRGVVPRLFKEPMILNKARVLSQGTDVLILSSGICTEEALRVTRALSDCKSSCSIYHMHITTIKPFNDPSVLHAIQQVNGGVITFENHSIIGGLGSAVSHTITDLGLNKRLVRLGLKDVFAHGASQHYLMKEMGIDAMGLVSAIEDLCNIQTGLDESMLQEVRVEAVHSLAKAEAL